MPTRKKGIIDQRILDQQEANRINLAYAAAQIDEGELLAINTVYSFSPTGNVGFNTISRERIYGTDEEGQQVELPIPGVGLLSPVLKSLTKEINKALTNN